MITAELLGYVFVLAAALILAVSPREPTARLYWTASLVVLAALSAAIRTHYFDSDIEAYATWMRQGDPTSYEMREPVIWFGLKALYYATLQNEVLTFWLMDLLVLSVVVSTFVRLRIPAYALLAFVIFFPFILGMQNIYRQWAGACFLMAAFWMGEKQPARSLGLYIVAALTHNVAAIFLPLVLMRHLPRLRSPILVASVIAIPIAIYIGAGTKSDLDTGASLGVAYAVLCATIFLFIALSHRFSMKVESAFDIYSSALISFTSVASAALLNNAPSERVSLFCLMLLYPALARSIEKMPLKQGSRIVFTLAGFVPILLFNTRSFILGVVVPGTG